MKNENVRSHFTSWERQEKPEITVTNAKTTANEWKEAKRKKKYVNSIAGFQKWTRPIHHDLRLVHTEIRLLFAHTIIDWLHVNLWYYITVSQSRYSGSSSSHPPPPSSFSSFFLSQSSAFFSSFRVNGKCFANICVGRTRPIFFCFAQSCYLIFLPGWLNLQTRIFLHIYTRFFLSFFFWKPLSDPDDCNWRAHRPWPIE